MPIQHDEIDAITFDVEMTEDGEAGEIRFQSEHAHEAIVTMSRHLLAQLNERLTALLKPVIPPFASH
jgi:hypothetical protein